MIELKNVSKFYKTVKAVNDVSFNVEEGQTVILLGTSGCGKTTTLRMVNRLVEPTEGTIFVNGKNIQAQQEQELRRGIGYVLQHTGLFPHYTIAENIAIVPRLMQWNEQKITERTRELLEKLQLDPDKYFHLYPDQLSGGQQQRIGLARALAANPPVLLMDEPFGALDPVTRAGIRKEFMNLDELKRKTILMVTHDVQEAFEMADIICLMDKGNLVQMGKPTELLFNPANDFVKNFFSDQRFLLGLQSITLNDVWHNLKEAPANEKAYAVDPASNLLEVLEMLSSNNSSITNYVAQNGKGSKSVTLPVILSAFSAYKTMEGHG
ncbi:MAG: ATP-binding cassette domain-containing protein [Chitinophagaceae bacterium]|nr:ATP-binding cassette domain-containing protein [Chitinophagaceae bacterium]